MRERRIHQDKLSGPFGSFLLPRKERRRGRGRASGRARRRGGGSIRGYALAADHLVLVVLAGKDEEGGLDDTTTETEHEVKGGLLLDVVVREGAAVLELLAREDQALLVRGDALLVLNLSLHVVDGVRRLDLEGDGLARDCGGIGGTR